MSTFNSTNPVDPLKLIRLAYTLRDTDRNPFNYCSSSGEVLEALTENCTHITIPSSDPSRPFLIFPRSVLTNYRSKRGSGPHYPLDSICFLLERKDDSYTTYLQDARRYGLTIVSLTDKRDLMEYITANELDEYAAIDSTAELPIPLMIFPDSPEAVREQEQFAQTRSIKSSKTIDEKLIKTSSTLIKTSNDSVSLDVSLIRPVQSTEAIFHSDKDFTMIHNSFKNLISSSSVKIPSGKINDKTTSSLLDQISSMNSSQLTKNNKNTSSSKKTVWIIIVPAGSNSLLTLHNVRDFLENSKYVSVAEARARGPKPINLHIEHSDHYFEIIDNPARLALSDWSRVLACFTLTSTWQFKGWKWETPLELFQHIVGFYVHFDDVAVDATVAGWNVTKLALSRNKRHLDATAGMLFWSRINDSIKLRLSKK